MAAAVFHTHGQAAAVRVLPPTITCRAAPDRLQTPRPTFSSAHYRAACAIWRMRGTVAPSQKLKSSWSTAVVRCSNAEQSVRSAVLKGEVVEKLASLGGVVSDDAVPEGHRGLHGFLYGSGGAEVHDEGQTYVGRKGEDDGTTIVSFDDWVTLRDAQRPAGVFGIYDDGEVLQYVGYARNIPLSLRQFRNRVGALKTASVRVKVFTDRAMLTRTKLEDERQRWLLHLAGEKLPCGNGEERNAWEGTEGSTMLVGAMSEEERTAYEETKLKLRKAMGENLYDDVEGEDVDARTRRLNLLRAVEGDDWSSVIDGQSSEILAADSNATTPSTQKEEGQIVSPFARPEAAQEIVRQSNSLPDEISLELTSANVEMVLDEVRPYLIADGGNVEVLSVESGIVALRLQGACGTCPSSSATMKMGIERALESKFGSALKQVVQVDKQDNGGATVESIRSHIDLLLPTITKHGGDVEVFEVNKARRSCDIKYRGPPTIGMGIQAAIRDKFPEIRLVNLIEFDG